MSNVGYCSGTTEGGKAHVKNIIRNIIPLLVCTIIYCVIMCGLRYIYELDINIFHDFEIPKRAQCTISFPSECTFK